MVETMKIRATPFKRSHARAATLSAPNSAVAISDPRLWHRLLHTHGTSGAVSCGVTAPFSWVLVHKVLSVPSKSWFPLSCVSIASSVVGLMATSSERACAVPRSTAPRAPAPAALHC